MLVHQETVEISGFGGGYEDQCQRMLWRGVAHLAEIKPPLEMWDHAKQYRNITGIMITDGADLKALEASCIHEGDDVTGAMHQAVMSHLAHIHRHTVSEWLAHLKERGREIITWEGKI